MTAVMRGMAGICEAISEAGCQVCGRSSGTPCVTSPDGYHMARAARAYSRGLITEPEFGDVLHAVGGFHNATVLYQPGGTP